MSVDDQRGELLQSWRSKQRFIELRDRDLGASTHADPSFRSHPDTIQSLKHRAAWADSRKESRNVSGPVTNEGHAPPGQGRKHDLAESSRWHGPAGIDVDDFQVQIGLANVVAAMRLAIDSTAEPHFRHAVMFEHFAGPFPLDFLHNALRD